MDHIRWLWSLVIGITVLGFAESSLGRPVPDETMGEERSRVIDRSDIDFDVDGGARRGRNLFHSFEDFDVDDGGSVYFLNPDGVANIFSRVTGAERSNILGRLGVRGGANLFFMNPNGILFGPNASLDVQGAFVGTTANAIGFGNEAVFSATNPQAPAPLLTINPAAFLFNQVPIGSITNRSTQGLVSDSGANVLLLGGNIVFDRGTLLTFGGNVTVGGLAAPGTVALTGTGQQPGLEFPTGAAFADLSFANGGGIGAFRGGGMQLQGRNIRLSGGAVLAVSTGNAVDAGDMQLQATGTVGIFSRSRIFSGVGRLATATGGDILVRAENLLMQNAQILAETQGAGKAGSVEVQLANTLALETASILSDPQPGSTGEGGNVTIAAPQLSANNRSLISASTFGAGDAGNIRITGDRLDFNTSSLVTTQTRGGGNAGDIRVDAQQLRLRTGSQFVASSFGGSNAGNLFVNADQIDVTGFNLMGDSSGFFSVIDANTTGQGGDIAVNAEQLRVENGGLISAATLGRGDAGNVAINADRVTVNRSAIEANTGTLTRFFGGNLRTAAIGNSGNVTIRADQLDLDNSFIRTQVGAQATGNAGNIRLDVQQLRGLAGAQISTATYGNGNAGNLVVQADQITLSGVLNNGASGLFSLVETGGNGQGGNISIRANQIRLDDNATITASTAGNGNAGELNIQADRLWLDNGSITASIRRGAVGQGGNIRIDANQLQLQNDSLITASTRGRGSAGTIAIQASAIDLNNSGVSSQVLEDLNTSGNGGNIRISAQRLTLRNAAQIDTSTFDNGAAGNIAIRANQLDLSGRSSLGSTVRTNGRGNAGTVTIQGQQLDMQSDSSINAGTLGVGRGGTILLDIDRIYLNDSSVTSSIGNTAVNQPGGDINIRADQLRLDNRSLIAAQVIGSGNGGEISITADRMAFNNSLISTGVVENTTGQAGNITLRGQQLSLRGGAQISPSLFGRGNAGNLLVQVDAIEIAGRNANGDSSFSSNVEENGNGRAGDIRVEADRLRLAGTANISASVEGVGEAGDITIRANQITLDLGFIRAQVRRQAREGTAGEIAIDTARLNLLNGGQISTGSFTRGDAGNIAIRAEQINITGENPANGQPSGIFSIIETQGRGQSGNIEITADRLQIRGGIITASTRGRGDAGDLVITADRLQIAGGLIATSVEQTASGDGGQLTVRGENLSLTNGGQIVTTTLGNGDAGTLIIEADRIDLTGARRSRTDSGAIEVSPSGFASSVQRGARGRGGNLRVDTNQLQVRNGARITAATAGSGNAGNVVVLSQEAIVLSGTDRFGLSSEIASSNAIGSQGRGGTITLRTDTLRISEGAVVNARTANADRGGNVIVQANRLEALNGGQIVTTTLRNGQAGSITLNVRDRITLSGQEANFRQRQTRLGAPSLATEGQGESGFFANSRADSTGNGGTIVLNTANLDLSDRARISAQSQGSGAAGGVTIRAGGDISLGDRARISTESQGENALAGDIRIRVGSRFTATDSDVTTSAANASGGDIRITSGDIRLSGDSDIRTDSARDGGNITLDAASIVAFDDSDIVASAAAGRGGDITLNTPAFFGSGYPLAGAVTVGELEGNARVDLNATGTVSSGNISTPDTSFIQNSLADLSETIVDADRLIANSCIARSETGGTFLVTGTGGLPPRPGDAPLSPYPTGIVRVELAEPETSLPAEAIVEPQGVYRLPDGRLVMSRECGRGGGRGKDEG